MDSKEYRVKRPTKGQKAKEKYERNGGKSQKHIRTVEKLLEERNGRKQVA